MANLEIVFHYSDLFKDSHPDIIETISNLNMHKTISIICELIQTKNYQISIDLPFLGKTIVPYESAMKNLLWPMETSEDLKTRAWYFNKNTHIYCEQYLLILLKSVLAYGDLSTLDAKDYNITADDYILIIRLCLAIGEKQHEKYSGPIDRETINHFIYGNYHVNRNSSVAAAFVRTYYLTKILANGITNFDNEIQNEYRDYCNAFESKYGFSIVQLINSLMWELKGYFDPDLRIAYCSIWKTIDKQYANTPCSDLEKKVITSLSQKISEYREWALKTIDEDWDFSEFLIHPFLADEYESYISISEYTITNALYYNVYWMIRNCYPHEDKNAMAFYGRLYELYLQNITLDATSNSGIVEYIPEFKFKNGNNCEMRSSDAYFKKDDKLIIVEMKGFMILIDSLIKNEKVSENYHKLLVKPVCQAFKCFENIQKTGRFQDIQCVYTISVTMDSVTSVPDYLLAAKTEINDKITSTTSKEYFNFNVDEYELFVSAIEKGIDPFEMLDDYIKCCKSDSLLMFQSYIRTKHPNIEMSEKMQDIYREFTHQLKCQFGTAG